MNRRTNSDPGARRESSLKRLRKKIAKWLYIPTEDLDAIDFVLAVFCSNPLPGDPVWGLLIDASGGGKTEVVRTLRKRPESYYLSTLTEKTLVSGYRDPKHPDKDPSLLPQLDGKVLIIKDLSPLLSLRRESRNMIIGDLRDAYDGFVDQGRGNLGRVSYEATFSVLGASTLALDRFSSFDQDLGERFIKFRCRSNQNQQKIQRAISNLGHDNPMRHEIEEAISEFLDSLPTNKISVKVPPKIAKALATIADFVATARSHVPRDRHHNLSYLPRPEVGTRLVKELGKLLSALALVRGKSKPGQRELKTVIRVAEDCLPPNRFAVLRCIRKAESPISSTDIAEVVGLPYSTARLVIEDLEVLRVIQKTSCRGNQGALWKLCPEWAERLQLLRLLE